MPKDPISHEVLHHMLDALERVTAAQPQRDGSDTMHLRRLPPEVLE
jgi:hypothetical protein